MAKTSSGYFLYNNSTVKLTDDDTVDDYSIKINCPKLGSGDLLHNTNSHFCKIQNIVDYNWQVVPQVNWLAIHRSLPLIAYVINPSYMKSLIRSNQPDPNSQLIRILNYEDRTLGLCKRPFSSTIHDLAFSYNSATRKDILIATIDLTGEVCVFSFPEHPVLINGRNQYDITCILVIKSDNCNKLNYCLTIAWCPYVGTGEDEDVEARSSEEECDPGMRLAIATDQEIEMFSVDRLAAVKQEHVRNEIDDEHAYYQFVSTSTKYPIIRLSLSNDATALCTVAEDNQIKFLQIASNNNEFELVHSWSPKLPTGDKISYFHFLDDYNKLLEDSSYHFWGFAFIGTQQGEISIWDLKKWTAIQRLQFDCKEFDDLSARFRYRVDISSHVITAIRANVAFIIQLEFDESTGSESRTPRITKITRFQLYNNLLSFVCKVGTQDHREQQELDVFWLTQKSLERCTIDNEQLTVDDQSTMNLLMNERKAPASDIKNMLRSNILTDLSMNTSTQSNVSLALSSLFNSTKDVVTNLSTASTAAITTVSNLPPPATLLTNPNQFFTETTSSLNKPPTPTSEEVQNLLKSASNQLNLNSLLPPLMGTNAVATTGVVSSANVSTTAAAAVAAVAATGSGGDTISTISKPYTKQGEQQPQQPSNTITSVLSKADFDEFIGQISDLVNQSILQTKLNSQEMIDQKSQQLETHFSQELEGMKCLVTNEMLTIQTELSSLQKTLKDPSHLQKTSGKVLDNFLKKLMEHLNYSLAKGLEEFFLQVRNETSEVTGQLSKLKQQHKTQIEAVRKDYQRLETQMVELNQKLSEFSVQQQKLMIQLKQTSVPPSPLPMYNNKMMVAANSGSFHPSPQMQHEETIKSIWNKIRSRDGNDILTGFTMALDMKDESLLTQILKHFSSSPSSLLTHIKSDQIVLVSFLNQLTMHTLDSWKIKFLSETIPSLDIKSPVVRSNLKIFIDKLIKKVQDVERSNDGEEHLLCALLVTILESYRKQIMF